MTRATKNFNRREVLIGTGAAIAVAGLALSSPAAFAGTKSFEESYKKITAGKTLLEGRIDLDVPEIAENGNSVPLSVSVESPMSEKDYVKTVYVLADGNPSAGVATFHFTPRSGEAYAATRMRLAKTQDIIAIAEMSDGSFYKIKKNVKVTIGGCGG